MSYFPKLYRDVYDRLAGDATLTALLAAGSASIWTARPSASAAMPFIVVNHEAGSNVDYLSTRSHDVRFNVVAHVELEVSGQDALAVGASIQTRIFGDWHAQSGGVPTYGLDRWTPALASSGWTATSCQLLTWSQSMDASAMWVYSFQVYASRVGV